LYNLSFDLENHFKYLESGCCCECRRTNFQISFGHFANKENTDERAGEMDECCRNKEIGHLPREILPRD